MIESRNPDGTPIFEVIRIRQACDVCIEADRAADCTHTAGDTPPWLTRDQDAALLAIAGAEIMAREVRNVDNARSIQPWFPKRIVDGIADFRTRRVPLQESVQTVFVGVDPALGGRSDYTIFSMTVLGDGRHVVRLLPKTQGGVDQLAGMLGAHVGGQRQERDGVHAHLRVHLALDHGARERGARGRVGVRQGVQKLGAAGGERAARIALDGEEEHEHGAQGVLAGADDERLGHHGQRADHVRYRAAAGLVAKHERARSAQHAAGHLLARERAHFGDPARRPCVAVALRHVVGVHVESRQQPHIRLAYLP
ncbi:MAG TPA: hypothetical protein VKD22_15900 [Ramlibacter sp.]|nr:hypothetical protein [Ramlibacter sp.]